MESKVKELTTAILKAVNVKIDTPVRVIIETVLEKSFYDLEKEVAKLKEELERSVTWSVEDFESKANERGAEQYDSSKFPDALEGMIGAHDCEYGITWVHVEHWLEQECKK